MILFVGSEEKGFFVKELAEKRNIEMAYISPKLHIQDQVQEILKVPYVDQIVYDVSQYESTAEDIANVIDRIKKANNATPIILAEGYSKDMLVIRRLCFSGVTQFVFDSFLADKIQTLEQCIDGINEPLIPEDGEEFSEEPEVEGQTSARTIAVAGAIHRMGTTTQALQFVKYLMSKGYKVCYIQMNSHGWVEELKEAYMEVEIDQDLGKVTFKEVDMFYKQDKIKEILKLGYDFFVYDYGVYSEWDFNKVSFLEKEIQVFVVGTKPGEFMKTYELIENNFYNNVYYIYNFIPNTKGEHEDTMELMQGKESMTYFADECRDPFTFSGSELYEKILPVESIVVEEVQKRHFFWKRKGK